MLVSQIGADTRKVVPELTAMWIKRTNCAETHVFMMVKFIYMIIPDIEDEWQVWLINSNDVVVEYNC